jgi:6-phosphogluconolactonase (cycloisomerase 2 family)
VVNEVSDFRGTDTGGVTAFGIDWPSGKLAFFNDVVSQGGNPCFLTADATGKYVLVANCGGPLG